MERVLTQRNGEAEGNDPMMNVLHVPPIPDVPSVDNETRPSTASHAPWPRVKLGEVCEFIGGGTPSKSHPEYFDGGIPWVSVRDMTRKVVEKTERTISKLGLENSAANLIPKGSIIISTHVGLGKVCLLSCDAAINQDIKAVIPKTADLSVEFLYAYFLINADYLISQGTGSTVKGVKLSFVENLSIPLPPLSVQRSIVARLERELGAVEKVMKAFEELERAAEGEFKAALKEAFESLEGGDAMAGRSAPDRRNREPTGSALEGGCGAQGTARPTAVRWVKLGEVCESVSSRGHQIKQSEIAEVGRFPVVSQSENEIEGYTDRDIAISEIPLVLFGDHTCAVKLIDKPFVVGADGVKLLRVADCLPRYLYSWLQQAAAKLLDGEYRRHFADLCELIIPLPILPVQREIVARLDAARERKERLVSAAKRGREAAALWRKAILKEAFE